MGENSAIEWTEHTFNPWMGCVKVSAGCVNCYAEAGSKRWGRELWGANADRQVTSDAYWRKPLKWNADAAEAGVPARVFCASFADVFEDNEKVVEARARLWELIAQTPWLVWLLLTKRPENILDMVPAEWRRPWTESGGWPMNVWAGTTIEEQRTVARLEHLVQVPAYVRFLSCEPLLGPVDLNPTYPNSVHGPDYLGEIDWIIAGGESGPNARPPHPAWFRSLRDQAASASVRFLFKQWGDYAPGRNTERWRVALDEDGGPGIVYPPGEYMRPSTAVVMERMGKKAAGRVLDGRTWDGVPSLPLPTGGFVVAPWSSSSRTRSRLAPPPP